MKIKPVTGQEPESSFPPRRLASTLWSCLYLSLALTAVFPAFAGFGYFRAGTSGVLAAAVAGLVCWIGASAALVLAGLFRGPQQAVSGLMLGMFFRMGFPLGAGLLGASIGGPLMDAGFLLLLVAYYMVALVVETLLSLRFVTPAAKAAKAV